MAGRPSPVLKTNRLLCKKWMLDIIRSLDTDYPQRFKRLNYGLSGISTKTLSERLKELESHKIISRKAYAEMPPKVEYSLTPKGKDLVKSLQSLEKWSVKWSR